MDLIKPIVELTKKRKAMRATTQYYWVPSHTNDEGNDGADALAGKASK
jgi:ribonuclease HI